MDRQTGLLLLLGGIALAAIASQASAADVWATGNDPAPPLIPPPDQATADQAVAIVTDTQQSGGDPVAAFLAVLRRFESNGDYSILYGGGHITDFSRFPYARVSDAPLITIGQFAGQHSTASGAYQINLATYNQFAPPLGITTFYPADQDALATSILQFIGAYDAINAGDIQTAFTLSSKRWASMPGSTAGQNPQTMTTAMSVFDQFLTG